MISSASRTDTGASTEDEPVGGPSRVVLALGSNEGDRLHHISSGVEVLETGIRLEAVSGVYESAPVGYLEQGDFLNAVLVGRTTLAPRELLQLAWAAEDVAGRVRSFPNAPRTLDVDLVFYGHLEIDEEGLVIPHPRWSERSFVLAPMAEVVPDVRPPSDPRTVAQRWADSRSRLPSVRRVAAPEVIWRRRS